MRTRKPRKPHPDAPARVIIEQSPGRITGVLSLNSEAPYPPEHESYVEKVGLLHFDACVDVVEIRSQPVEESLTDATTSRRRHFPDSRILLRSGVQRTVEFKPLKIATSEEGLTDLISLGLHYRHRQEPFDIFTDTDFELEPRRSTAVLLHHYARSRVDDRVKERLLSLLSEAPKSVDTLRQSLGFAGVQRDVYALIAQKHLCIDWAVPLSVNTPVSLPNKPFEGLTYEDLLSTGRFRHLLQELALGIRPTDQRLLAAARTYQRSIRSDSDLDFVGALPDQAYVGRHRTFGSLVSRPESEGDSSPNEDSQT